VYTEQITQRLALMNGANPQTLNNSNVTAGSVDMQQSRRAFFALYLGAVTGGGSITAQLVEDTQASLATATNLAGSNTSQVVNTANKITTFEVRAGQLSKRYLGLKITETGSQNVVLCCLAWGDEGVHKPNNANNGTNVATQNVVS
jgi:hypothetical protein